MQVEYEKSNKQYVFNMVAPREPVSDGRYKSHCDREVEVIPGTGLQIWGRFGNGRV
jgi:hypothetical protein